MIKNILGGGGIGFDLKRNTAAKRELLRPRT
jgi:hypothetical protein